MGTRSLFLRLVGVVYVFSIGSFLLQYPWVHGVEGLEPTDVFVQRVQNHFGFNTTAAAMDKYPLILWPVLLEGRVDVDTAMEGICILGLAAAVLLACGVHHVLLLLACFAVNHTLVALGQSMSAFQWDILVLESGFLAIFYGGFGFSTSRDEVHQMRWPVRLLALKLFLLSGAGKMLNGCPTWKQLTALKYHYASQCIPTPLAYVAETFIPDHLDQLSVAAVLFIQIFISFALVAPFVYIRRVAAVLQSGSMVAILLTGNYNWFNIHAIGLCMVSWADDAVEPPTANSVLPIPLLFYPPLLALACTVSEASGLGLLLASLNLVPWLRKGLPVLQLLVLATASVVLYLWSFESVSSPRNLLTNERVNTILGTAMPVAIPYVLFSVLLTGLSRVHYTFASATSIARKLLTCCYEVFVTAAALFIVINSFGHMATDYAPVRKEAERSLGPLLKPAVEKALEAGDALRMLHPFSSYGLFRRMTGVGDGGEVAVPVLVLEYNTREAPDKWNEIVFRYAVGPVDRRPPWVAPYQPRTDWRLWFAALGNYQSDPWVIHLAVKFLRQDRTVKQLLDPVTFAPLTGGTKPLSVRGKLYHYKFAEHPSEDWWQRKLAPQSDWMPPIQADNPQVRDFLKRKGWSAAPRKQKDLCGNAPQLLCDAVWSVRKQLTLLREQDAGLQFFSLLLTPVLVFAVQHFLLGTPRSEQAEAARVRTEKAE